MQRNRQRGARLRLGHAQQAVADVLTAHSHDVCSALSGVQQQGQGKPGSGLGLSIVVELASLYGGGLTLGTAPIGGLRAELVVPGA